ncbi:Hpt domain protein [Novipirellula galeiformis]|uniref:Hpt domain protein n=1 Tax=Novipirellula galeiformis TaxID=2528004 RepID=A0A5C6CHD3_9BACT|nr:Hpt domain-containing protein [Novipirellula galeiformis]TWU23157.1 Hpt domain protein [Novipirellula galeiformis]
MHDSPPPSHDWRTQLSGYAGHNKETLVAISDAFLDEVPMLMSRIKAAFMAQDTRTLRTSAHTLKSCFRYVASDEDIAAASEVEKNADHCDTITTAQIDHIETLAKQWCDCVKQLRDETAASL